MADPRLCGTSWPRANSALEIAASQLRAECLRLMIRSIEKYSVKNGSPKTSGLQAALLLSQAVLGSGPFDMILSHGEHYQAAMKATFKCLLPKANRVAWVQGYGGFNQSLLYHAVSFARDEAVEYLLEHADEDMRAGEDYDEGILATQDVGAFRKTDINRACGVDMRTPLLEAVRWNRPKMVKLLLQHGADATGASKNPFSAEDSTWTALHVLAHAGQDDPRLVDLLLSHGTAIDGFEDHFRTTESPLLVALQNDEFRLAEALVSNGADINFTTLSSGHITLTNPTTILGHVIGSNARNSIARIRYLLGTAPFRSRLAFIIEPERKWTALHRAAAAHIDTDFRATNATGATELDWVDIDWGANREILVELLRHYSGAERLNAVEQSVGLTALHLAVLAGNDAAVALLIEHGASRDVANVAGKTAAALALQIQMGALSTTGDNSKMGRKEKAARDKCSALLNNSNRPITS